ncbi:uncharacterized protein LOC133195618 [Saccostrea echinata]|uniref:uncharacterized protein LOC133195618 n=1 Tax=Saccostrea echinata TaxID=191078 RepID=UPI002A82C452|nr:uncharacterized protein LOC133195618 [Saccostrea echinata]
MCLKYSMAVLISTGIVFLSTSAKAQTNLPKKVSLPENTETGTEIFRVEFDEGGEGRSPLELYSMFPAVAYDIFEFNEQNYSILIKNGSLLDFEGKDKAYVIRLEEIFAEGEEISEGKQRFVVPMKQDLTVLIELQDVLEGSQSVVSSSDKGCCDDVRQIIWLTPVVSSLEVIVIVISIVIVMMCFFKKERTTRVEAFNPGK